MRLRTRSVLPSAGWLRSYEILDHDLGALGKWFGLAMAKAAPFCELDRAGLSVWCGGRIPLPYVWEGPGRSDGGPSVGRYLSSGGGNCGQIVCWGRLEACTAGGLRLAWLYRAKLCAGLAAAVKGAVGAASPLPERLKGAAAGGTGGNGR